MAKQAPPHYLPSEAGAYVAGWNWCVSAMQVQAPMLSAAPQPAAVKQDLTTARCWCETCRPRTIDDMRFIVCPDCGNKRCPKANDHRNACTNSNAVGQPGSSWEHVKPATPQPNPSTDDIPGARTVQGSTATHAYYERTEALTEAGHE